MREWMGSGFPREVGGLFLCLRRLFIGLVICHLNFVRHDS